MYQVKRYHDICAGHRVHGHESKCSHMHGHNYRIHFVVEPKAVTMQHAELDTLGRVVDFSVVKSRLCEWLERNWDHKFLAWEKDTFMQAISEALNQSGPVVLNENHEVSVDTNTLNASEDMFNGSIVWVPFNPTAENMAAHLVEVIGPKQLDAFGVELTEVTIEETAKCHVTYKKKL